MEVELDQVVVQHMPLPRTAVKELPTTPNASPVTVTLMPPLAGKFVQCTALATGAS